MQKIRMTMVIMAGVAMLSAGAVILAAGPVQATPAIAQKTGQPCTQCHTAPPALNAYGKKYKENMKK
jgi:hypothetical protein